MGRASNRKKARRLGGQGARRASRAAPAQALETADLNLLLAGLEAMNQQARERESACAVASLEWCGGSEPDPAELPDWPSGSLGERFFTSREIEEARLAPSPQTADIPPGMVIVDDPAHWNVATHCLIRAIVFDGLSPDDPPVRRLLRTLAPIAVEELAYCAAMAEWNFSGAFSRDEPPEFPELDGPVFLLGGSALVDAFGAVLGEEPLDPVLRVLRPVLRGSVRGLDGSVLADALTGAFATHFRCEQPGDAEVLARIGTRCGNPLEELVSAGAVAPDAVLPVGLHALSVLAALCRSDAVSLTAQTGS